MISTSLFNRIRDIKIIDSHEHIGCEKYTVGTPKDFFDLLIPYVCDDLISSGMTKDEWFSLQNKSLDIPKRWDIFKLHYNNIKFGTYFQAVLRTLRDVYDINEITLENIIKLSKRMSEENQSGIYDKVFKLCNIEKMMSFLAFTDYMSCDNRIIPVPTVSHIIPRCKEDLEQLGLEVGRSIHTLQSLLEAISVLFEKYSKNGVRTIKFGSGYNRRLDFSITSFSEASDAFDKLLKHNKNGDESIFGTSGSKMSYSENKPLDDYLTYYMVDLASKYSLTVVFHVGIHAWNENYVDRARATYLNELISQFKEVRFVILHSGIPYIDDAVLLCKYYKNVYLNMTWMHIIDREKSKEAMRRYLEMLPVNKIIAFGGDYTNIESIYGHYIFALENMAQVFQEFIDRGAMNEDQAIKIARMWLYDNVKTICNIAD